MNGDGQGSPGRGPRGTQAMTPEEHARFQAHRKARTEAEERAKDDGPTLPDMPAVPRSGRRAVAAAEPAPAPSVSTVTEFDIPVDAKGQEAPVATAGRNLDGYLIQEFLDRGGMGQIFTATNKVTGSRYAVKLLNRRYRARQDIVVRFENEARFMLEVGRSLRDDEDGFVKVHHVGRDAELGSFIVMDLIDGHTLRDLLNSHVRIPIPRAVEITIRVARVTGLLHGKKIFHRDLKPENIMLVKQPRDGFILRVLDLGCAKGPSSARTTDEMRTVGSPLYMSPEQARGEPCVEASDIYSLAHVLYEMLKGDHALGPADRMHPGASSSVKLGWHLYAVFRSLDAGEAPGRLWNIISRGLARPLDERYASMEELAKDLADFLKDHEEKRFPELKDVPRRDIEADSAVSPQPPLLESIPRHPVPLTSLLLVPSLVISEAENTEIGLRYAIPRRVTLGRVPELVDIAFPEEATVSSKHCVLTARAELGLAIYEVEDFGSRNGTEVSGLERDVAILYPGQSLRMGQLVLKLHGPGKVIQTEELSKPARAAGGLTAPRKPQRSPDPVAVAAKDASLRKERLERLDTELKATEAERKERHGAGRPAESSSAAVIQRPRTPASPHLDPVAARQRRGELRALLVLITLLVLGSAILAWARYGAEPKARPAKSEGRP